MLKIGMLVKFTTSVASSVFGTYNASSVNAEGTGVYVVTAQNAEFMEGEVRCGHAETLTRTKEVKREAANVLPVLTPAPEVNRVDPPAKRKSGRRAVQP